MTAESADRPAEPPAGAGGARRDALLDQIALYCIEHGVVDLTLRGVSEAVGSNNRMLLYYFGSREDMISAALRHAVDRYSGIRTAFESLGGQFDEPLEQRSADPGRTVLARLDRAWALLADPGNLAANRLFFETVVLAVHTPGRFDAVLDNVNHVLTETIAAMLVRHGADRDDAMRCGHEVAAEWRGLQLALLTGNAEVSPELLHRAVAARVAAQLRDEPHGSVPLTEQKQ